jgi:hypothetical protein
MYGIHGLRRFALLLPGIFIGSACAAICAIALSGSGVPASSLTRPEVHYHVPMMMSYQGRITLPTGQPFSGTGQFRFAIIDRDSRPLWSNDGSAPEPPNPPKAAVLLPVHSGLFHVLLGDTSLLNMTELVPDVFGDPNLWLANYGDQTVSVLRASDGALVKTLTGFGFPAGSALDGAFMWVTNSSANTVTKR